MYMRKKADAKWKNAIFFVLVDEKHRATFISSSKYTL